MRRTAFSLDILNDKSPWLKSGLAIENTSGFSHKIQHLVREVMENELTEVQRDAVTEFYYNGKTVTQIAKDRGVNKSTVSRNLKVARNKIGMALKYGAFHLWDE